MHAQSHFSIDDDALLHQLQRPRNLHRVHRNGRHASSTAVRLFPLPYRPPHLAWMEYYF
jgi:hypothetical protein